jgi:hypothetical protein
VADTAAPGITDSTGRTVDAQLTARAIVDLLLANTSNEVLKVNVVQADDTNDVIEQVTDAVEQLDTNIRTDLQAIHQTLQQLFNFFQTNRGTAGGTMPTSAPPAGGGGGRWRWWLHYIGSTGRWHNTGYSTNTTYPSYSTNTTYPWWT